MTTCTRRRQPRRDPASANYATVCVCPEPVEPRLPAGACGWCGRPVLADLLARLNPTTNPTEGTHHDHH